MDNITNLFLLIFIWNSLHLCVDCKQTFLEKPRYTEVNPGDTVVLSCRVNNIGGECRWQKDRRPIRTFSAKYEWNTSTNNGDCSFKIYNASITIDDGEWECQVTDSAFDKMDSLSSEPARIVVRVPPKEPTIEHNTSHLARGQNLTTREEQSTTVKCASHYGNPPAAIRWYLGDVDITAYSTQTNTSEPDNPRTWFAVSILDYSFPRAENGKSLRCMAFHEAYDLKSKEISVRLNVQYPPITKLHGAPTKDLEENKDSLNMRCTADANPSASVSWKKIGMERQLSTDRIQFSSLKRDQSGMYMCEARNSLGQSVTQTVEIDVKYPPKIKAVTPLSEVIRLSNRTTLSCLAEGNPPPYYQWLHSMTGDSHKSRVVGKEPIFVVTNTSYEHQGSYVCVATNTINQEERSVQSQVVKIEVFGPPQVLQTLSSSSLLLVEKGFDAVIQITFCSKPPPLNVSWEWGSVILPAGEGSGGKYVAKSFSEMGDVKGCYKSELIIQKVEPVDSRRYVFKMGNSLGLTNYPIFLHVEEPISMLTVIGIVIACLVVLVVSILVVLYAFRTERWCFRKKDILKNNVESNGDGVKEASLDTRSNLSGAIPPDALYSVPPKSNSKEGYQGDNVSEYDSMMNDHNHHQHPHHHPNDHRSPSGINKQEVVYADLDFAHSKNANSNKVIRRESPTEYAPIQVQYRPKPDEQADI